MTTNPARGSVVGLQYVQAWLVDSQGRAMGTVGEGAPGGTTTHALVLDNAKSAQLPNPTRIVTALTGGNRWRGQVAFGINEVGNFPVVMAEMNGYFHALAGASSQDTTTNSRWRRYADNLNLENLPQLGLMMTTIYQSREDGSDGVNLWISYIVPRCQVQPGAAPMAYQAEGEAPYTVFPTFAEYEPHGVPLSAGAMNLRKNKTVMYVIVSPKPLAITTHINGETPSTTFTLGFRPTSDIITLNNTANELAINGTLVALDSVNTATAVATKAAAGAEGDADIVLYETDFEPVAA